MKISVAIITRNRSKKLLTALEALAKQSVMADEIIVVDNGSTDNTKKITDQFLSLPIHYIYEPKVGIPNARNCAIKKASGEILAFTDDDCIPPTDYVKKIIFSHNRNPDAVAIQGKTIPLNNNSMKALLFRTNYEYWIWKNTYKRKYLTVCDTNNISLKINKIRTMNLKFNTNLKRGSDVDFAKRIIKKGGVIVFDRSVRNYHAMRDSWLAFYHQRFLMGQAQVGLDKLWPEANEDKEFQKDYYKLALKKMFESKTGFAGILLRLAYKTYDPLFWISTNLSKKKKQKKIQPQKYISNKKTVPVTVAIVTRNREVYLEQCLSTLFRQKVMPQEVVIIDNASTDNTKDVFQRFKKLLPIKYYFEKKIGTSYARNKAIQVAQMPIIAFIDDDCQASPVWLEEVYKAHQKYPNAAAIQGGCRVIPYKGTLSFVYEIAYRKWLGTMRLGRNHLLTLDTANASFKKNIIKNLEVQFDKLFIKYCDDGDFCQQILSKGGEVRYWPKALVGCRRRQNRVEFFRERFRKGVAKGQFDEKWSTISNGEMVYKYGNKIIPHEVYKSSKIRLKSLLLNPKQKDLEVFFNSLKKTRIIYLKIRVVTLLFEYLYHVGYNLTRIKIRFNKIRILTLNKPISRQPKPSLAIMIITKDRYNRLTDTLNSLINQRRYINEVIVIDSSTKINKALIEIYSKKLPLKHHIETAMGFGVARNSALYSCESDIIATIDDDAIAATDWCKQIINSHCKTQALAIQGRIVCSPENSPIAAVEQLRLDNWFMGNIASDGSMTTLSTKNVSFKVRRAIKLGLQFQENSLFGQYGSEDLDFANQLLHRNEKIYYNSEIQVFHYERSNLLSYIKQQYRKGCSNAILEKTWNSRLIKGKYYPNIRKPFEALLLIAAHPSTRGKILSFPLLLIIYLMSVYFFNKGKKEMFQYIRKNQNQLILGEANSQINSTNQKIIVILNPVNQTFYRRALYILQQQSVLPIEIYINLSEENDYLNKLLPLYTKHIKIKFYKTNNDIQKIIRLNNNSIIAYLNPSYLPDKKWIENIYIQHQIYLDELYIQGRVVLEPSNSINNILSRFNQQSLIRNTMTGDKNLYWSWMNRSVNNDFKSAFFDDGNLSMKTSIHKQEEKNNSNPQQKKLLILSPEIVVTNNQQTGILDSVIKYIDERKSLVNYSPSKFISNKKRLPAFVLFCLKNKYFAKLPVLVMKFCIFEVYYQLHLKREFNSEKSIRGALNNLVSLNIFK